MLKKTITYTDYNGVEREEDFYFHMSKPELLEMELTTVGGYTDMINKIIAAKDQSALLNIFKEFVFKAYGEKSPDGRQFMKSEAISKAFSETPAYSEIYMELVTDADAAARFVNGVIPEELQKKNTKSTSAKTSK